MALLNGEQVQPIGHRVVHDGTEFNGPVRVDATSWRGSSAWRLWG